MLSEATLTTRAKDLRLDAKEAEIIGTRASPLTLTWAADGSHANATIGELLHLDVRPTADGAQFDLDVAPSAIADIASRLHLDIGSRARLTAHAAVTVHGSGSFEGNATAAVDGWIQAHPKELDGILYGNKTKATVSFKAGDDRANVALNPVRVQAGALNLKGAGTIQRGGERLGKLKVDLQGSLRARRSCAPAPRTWAASPAPSSASSASTPSRATSRSTSAPKATSPTSRTSQSHTTRSKAARSGSEARKSP